MANAFFRIGHERAGKVEELFSGIASRYDLINDLQSLGLHRHWKRRLAQLAVGSPGGRALDVCCGTGDVARALAHRGARVVGLDFSDPMLRRAQRRERARADIDARSGEPVHLVRGDALALPFASDSFEAVTISYGLRNLARLEEGLREMLRVTKPGGCVVILDFSRPGNAFWRWAYLAYLRVGVPVFGRVFCGNAEAYAYILESLRHFPAPEGIAQTLTGLGSRRVTITRLLGGAMALIRADKP